MISAELASTRPTPSASARDTWGSQVMPASTLLLASSVATCDPSVLNNCTSFSSSLTSASALISNGYCCEPSPGKAILAPLSCATLVSLESLGTRIAVWSRMSIATNVAGKHGRAHSRGRNLQLAGGERLIFRRPVGERPKHDLDLVLFFDRLEKSRSVRDKNRLSRGLDSEIDDFFRLRRRAKANRRRKREYWIIRSADHGTLPDLLKTLVTRHPRLSGRHRQALWVISKDRACSKTSQQRVVRRQRTLP